MTSGGGSVDWAALIVGLSTGLVARMLSIQRDSRHYPGWPSGMVNQFTMGAIAALIGGAIGPALLAKQWQAATFLTLAATQFQTVRQNETSTLQAEEQLLLVQRGPAYIMGIAQTFESRNFLAMLTAAAAALVTLWLGVGAGIASGVLFLAVDSYLLSGRRVGDFVSAKVGKIRMMQDSLLYVDDVMLMEVGLPHPRLRWEEEGLGIVLTPRTPRGETLLWDLAQRQAIVHEVAAAIGVQQDVGYPEQTPLLRMRMPYPDGTAALGIIPVYRDLGRAIRAIENTPVLEAVRARAVPAPHVSRKAIMAGGQGGREP